MSKYKILVVEDEPAMLNGLKDNLEFEGYEVDTAPEGNEGLDKILNNSYHLVLLDVMLPNISGFDICKKAKQQDVPTPIVFLSAKGEEIDKVLGLEFGADDYITKPFSLRELLARIKVILKRTANVIPQESNDRTTIGNMEVNFSNYEAFVNGDKIKMSFKEFEILHYLWNNRNDTVSRDDILDNIWGEEYQPTSRTIDNFIVRLRNKIEENPNESKIILTVHGVGYKLIY